MRCKTRTKLCTCLVVCLVLLGCQHYRSQLHTGILITSLASRKPSLLLTNSITTRQISLVAVNSEHKDQTEALSEIQATMTQGSLAHQTSNQIASFKSYDSVQHKLTTPSLSLRYLEKVCVMPLLIKLHGI